MKKIQILGTGCPECRKLAEKAETAAKEPDIEDEMEKETDINEIMKFAVMIAPALSTDVQVKGTGKVLSVVEEIRAAYHKRKR